ncbi:MAG: hypothetical protein HBSAPP03_16930 [Phycisphaerae bacterium]|nr:MAG: hypothetical protein HBSAPP03_16930 [Phycisphaerae bacterium]
MSDTTPISSPPTMPGPISQPKDPLADPSLRWVLPVGRSPWAIAAGYLGLFSVLVFPGPIALIVSLMAVLDLRRHPERCGWGRTIFGLLMGLVGTGILAFAFLT